MQAGPFMYACSVHACGYDETAICADLRQHKTWIAILDAGKPAVYTDAEAGALAPKRLQTYLHDYQ